MKCKLTSCYDVPQPRLMVCDRVQRQIHVVHDFQPDQERVYLMDGVLEQGLSNANFVFVGMLKTCHKILTNSMSSWHCAVILTVITVISIYRHLIPTCVNWLAICAITVTHRSAILSICGMYCRVRSHLTAVLDALHVLLGVVVM